MATLPARTTLDALATVASAPPRLLAANAAFDVVFGVFVVAFVALVVITLRWAVRRDRVGRAEWVRRQQPARDVRTGAPPPRLNGQDGATTRKGKGKRGGRGPQGGGPRAQ